MNSVRLNSIKPITRSLRMLLHWWDHSISHRITASALALTLTIGAAIGGGSYLVTQKLLEDAILRELANETTLAARQVESTLNILYADLSRMSSNGILVRALADCKRCEGGCRLWFMDDTESPLDVCPYFC